MSRDSYRSVTVVVPTRNRANALPTCLGALQRLDYPRFEILVVDNGSTDSTAATVAECASGSTIPVRYVFESRPGISHARNCGLRNATCEVVAFVDDDCYPAQDWLRSIAAEFDDPAVAYVGGRVLLHDATDAPFSINESTARTVIGTDQWNSGDDIPGSGMGIRRAAAIGTGGYDTFLGAGSPLRAAEDIDMHWRLWAAGWVGVFTPAAVIYHAHGRKPGSPALDSLQHNYAIGRGAWYAKRLLLGPYRGRTFYAWTVWEMRRQTIGTTLTELRGLFRYLRLALPLMLRDGLSALHPPITPNPTPE